MLCVSMVDNSFVSLLLLITQSCSIWSRLTLLLCHISCLGFLCLIAVCQSFAVPLFYSYFSVPDFFAVLRFFFTFSEIDFLCFFSVVGLLVSWLIFLCRIALFYPVTLSHSFILLLSILFSKTKLPFQIELIWVSSAFSCFWSFCWLVVW